MRSHRFRGRFPHSHRRADCTPLVSHGSSLFVLSLLLPVLFAAFLIFFSFFVRAASETTRPAAFSDPDGMAENGSFAFDGDNTTYALIAGAGNISFSGFSDNGWDVSDPLRELDLLFDLEVDGVVDDQWGLDYSNDSGSSWHPLRTLAAGNLSRQQLRYDNVTGPAPLPYTWNWTSISSLRVRVRYVATGSPDPVVFRLYESWAEVTADREGPSISLVGPVDGANYSGLTEVNFTYDANDALSGLGSCTLLLNGSGNVSDPAPSETATNNLSVILDDGRYNWSIRCLDDSSSPTENTSEQRSLTVDNAPPVVTLLSPGDASTLDGARIVQFTFRHEDVSALESCSLFLNGSLNATVSGSDANWPTGEGMFVVDVEDGLWEWNVSCTDIYGRMGASAAFSFTQEANDAPVIENVTLPASITLALGTNVSVGCNATVSDPQGRLTIASVVAYLHRVDRAWNASDETSLHHTDAACIPTGINATSAFYECAFLLPYYARAGNWSCTFRAEDDMGFGSLGSASSSVETLYAFNLSPSGIAYGLLLPGEISDDVPVVVTNLGNSPLDMALEGYAQVPGDGLALVCDVGNTSIEDERYALSGGALFESMAPLTPAPVQVDAFDLEPRNDSFAGQRTLYWKVRLGVPQKGGCSGFVTFTAVQS